MPYNIEEIRRNQLLEVSRSQPIISDKLAVPRMMEPKYWKFEVIPVKKPMRFDPNNNEDFIMEDATETTRKEKKVKGNPTKKKTPYQSVISTIVDP